MGASTPKKPKIPTDAQEGYWGGHAPRPDAEPTAPAADPGDDGTEEPEGS